MMRSTREIWPALTALLLLLVYATGLNGPWLHDDFSNISGLLRPFQDFEEVIRTSFSNASGLLRRPIANFSFIVNSMLTGAHPLGFKLFNLVLHGFAAVALYRFLRSLASTWSEQQEAHRLALLAAMLWSLHPLFVSTVLYVVQRMSILAALFTFLSMEHFVKWVRRGTGTGTSTSTSTSTSTGYGVLGLAILFAALALLSKENAALIPLLLGVCLWVMPAESMDRRRADIARWGVALTLLLGVVAFVILHDRLMDYTSREFDLAQRTATQAITLWKYLALWFWPDPTRMALFWDGEPIHQWSGPVVWAAVTALAGTTYLAIRLRLRAPIASFAVLFFLTGHALESSILPLEMAYEHRNYLPMASIAMFTASLLLNPKMLGAKWRRSAIVVLVAALAVLTAYRSYTWGTYERFAMNESRNQPQSARATNIIFTMQVEEGDIAGALITIRRMDSIPRIESLSMTVRLLLSCKTNQYQPDWVRLTKASMDTRQSQRLLFTHQNITNIISSGECKNLPKERYIELLSALAENFQSQRPDFSAEYHHLIATIHWHENRMSGSEAHLREAIKLAPTNILLRERMVMVLAKQKRYDDAQHELVRLEEAIREHRPQDLRKVSEWQKYLSDSRAGQSTPKE